MRNRGKSMQNLKNMIKKKQGENTALDISLEDLALSVAERRNINDASSKFKAFISPTLHSSWLRCCCVSISEKVGLSGWVYLAFCAPISYNLGQNSMRQHMF